MNYLPHRPTPAIVTIAAITVTALLMLPTLSAQAQERPRITVTKDTRAPVVIRGLNPEAASILANDLDLSGVAVPSHDGAGVFTAEGSLAGGVKGRLRDASGAILFDKAFPGSPRMAIHRFADEIVRAISGRPGIAATQIAFISRRSGRKEVFVADYDGANVRQLTQDGALSVSPAISPNGRFVAYTGYQSGYADVYLIDLANGGRRPLVRAPGTNSGSAFAPDSSRLALTMSRDGNPEIYVVGLGGGGGRRLTRHPATDSSPSWSPSGSEIVFVSDRTGSPQLFRMSASGGGPGRLNTGFSYATEPDWAPDGSKIAFTARGGGGLQIAVLDLASGSTRIIGSGEDPAWGPNSRHLIYSQGGSLHLHDTLTGRRTTILSGMRISEPSWSRSSL